MLLELLENY